MGILEDVTSVVSSAVSEAKQTAGEVVNSMAHVTGGALAAVGLDSAAQTVDNWGDHVADGLGDQIPEKQLGQSTDPTQLLHGDVTALNTAAGHLTNFATAFANTAQGLSTVDTSHWVGDAAAAFRAVYTPHTKEWSTAQQACANAATALSGYARAVGSAQGQAQQAIDLYQQGTQATQQAQAQYNAQVDAYNTAAQNYNATAAAGNDPGAPPTQPGPFNDPGAAQRQQAQNLLDQARQERDAAAGQAASALAGATGLAPAKPSVLEQVADDIGDTAEGLDIGAEHFVGGVIKGTAGLVAFARSLNPADPYNITHPADYVAGLSTTAAGFVRTAMHPTQLVSTLVGTGWGSDPFEAMGKLVPNVALGVLTDGAGTAAEVGGRVAVGTAEEVAATAAERAAMTTAEDAGRAAGEATAEDAAGSAAREQAGEATQTTRDPNGTPCADDPVDVATGHVLLPQVDVELPGVLPLVLERVHLSDYRLGHWFGRTWASTMDTRLEVDADGVIFVRADGVRLFYPLPGLEAPVLPEEGARWPLHKTVAGGYTVSDPQTGRAFHFPRSCGAGRWPVGTISDRCGHHILFRYDAGGVPAEIVHDGGYRVRITVEDDRITALHLVGAGEPDAELMRYGYTAGNLAEVVNSSGQPLRLGYDEAGRLAEWVDRNGVRYGYRYDQHGRCVRTEGQGGGLSGTFDYYPDERVTMHTDTLGAVTRFEYDERLRVVAETDPLGNTSRSEYHRYGWLLSHTDPLGRCTRYTVDDVGNPTVVTRPDGSQALTEYGPANQPTVAVEPDGAVWHYTYDEQGNNVEVTDPVGATTRHGFTERGHLATVTDALGNTTHVDTDAAGLPIAVTDPTGAVTRYTRDAFGRIVEQTDPAGGITRFGWTVDGNLAWRASPDSSVERWLYDGEGNLIEHVDALGQATRYEFSDFDRPSACTTPDGARLEYRYDHRLRLVSVTNQQGLVWRYTYDPAGRLLAETDYHGGITRYGYDPAGQLISRTNPVGQAVTYRRDPLGNVVEQQSGDEITRYTYDPVGRLVYATNQDSQLLIQHDLLGRVVAESVNGRTLTFEYDALGQRVERVTPSGVRSGWEHDRGGRPVRVRTAGHTISFRHDAAGHEVERRLDGVFGLVQTWDANHRLISQTLMGAGTRHQYPTGVALTMLQHRAYRYRPDGRLAAMVDHLSGTRRLNLDAVGRITAVQAADGRETYRYDVAGNIVQAGWPVADQPVRTVDPRGERDYAGNLIVRAGAVRYQHDSAGRIVARWQKRLSSKDLVWRYVWDGTDRLVGVITPDGTRWRYRYDPLGRRVAKQRLAPDSATVVEQVDFTWDGSQLVEQDHDTTHVTTWEYAPGEHRPLTQVERVSGPGPASGSQDWFDQRFYAIVTDLVGTPTELVDSEGVLAWHEHTTVWGAALGRLAGGATTPLRFPGQYFDAETGLHYNYHRYYDPFLGRYQTSDPLGLGGGPNTHAYVPNPTLFVDPLGLTPCKISGTDGLDHSFDRHAAQWFGRPVPKTTHMQPWEDLVTRASNSSLTFDWASGATPTTAYLAKIDGKYFVTQFWKEGPQAGELLTAFVPGNSQVNNMLRAAGVK